MNDVALQTPNVQLSSIIMLAYPPLSISFKMYVQSSFIYPLSLF